MVEKELKGKEDSKSKLIVVDGLPTQSVRDFTEEGKHYTCVTKDEALAEILEIARELKRGLLQ